VNVLVTGATGFIGSNLVHHLLQQGDQVRVLVRRSPTTKLLKDLPIETCVGDVTSSESLVKATCGVEAVYHVAGVVSYWPPRRRWQHRVNVEGTRNVIDAAVRNRVRRLVYTSSIAAVGFRKDDQVADEDTPWNWAPYDIGYCNSKHLGEREAQRGSELGLEVVIVNPALVFGSRDVNWNAGRMFKMVAERSKIRGVDGWTTTCDVDDVCTAQIGAMQHGLPGRRYILGGEARSYPSLIREIADVMGKSVAVETVPYPLAQAAAHATYALSLVTRKEPALTPELVRMTAQRRLYSSRRAISELGYPQTPLRSSLEKTYQWYRDNGRL
jgi:dihydroflavonol-4-reductase